MSDESWYETCQGQSLKQGDLLPRCEVVHWAMTDVSPDGEIATTRVATDAVVITQSCDLTNEGKTDFVLLAELIDYDKLYLKDGKYRKRDFRANCSRGRFPHLALLPPNPGAPALSWSIIDFSRLYTLPKTVVESHAGTLGIRLRLRSPYREHISQAFGRYFMRVGLPKGLESFDKYEPSAG